MSTAESRKVLEEIQKAKTTLLKQGAAGAGGPVGGSPLQHPLPPQPPSNHFPLVIRPGTESNLKKNGS